jgi:hypothetical protein
MIKADVAAWEQAIKKLRAAKAACSRLKHPRDRDIQDAQWEDYYRLESALLEMPAPDINAVIAKLMLIFAEDLASGAPEALHKSRVIGDLRRIKTLNNLK